MPSAANVAQRMQARIRASAHQLTIHYPAAVVPPTAPSPTATAPVSPLTGVKPPTTLTPAATTPRQPPETVACLWYDAMALNDLKRTLTSAEPSGWVVGAEAMATVILGDAVVDPARPSADTKFDTCAYVEHDSSRYEVLRVTPGGAGFAKPYCYHVWLKGAKRQ